MKLTKILITGMLGGTILFICIMLTSNLGAAQEISDSEQDMIKVVLPISQETLEDGSDVIAKAAYLEGEQDSRQDIISVTVFFDQRTDLPERIPDVRGVLLNQSESSYQVGSHTTRMVNGERTCQPLTGGKESEVIINGSTRFIEDATDFSQAKPINGSSDLFIHQKLKSIQQPGVLPDCASMLAWGEWQGDQLSADVILFHDELH